MMRLLVLTSFLVGSAAAADPGVSFTCDGDGNLLSFESGGELTFDATLPKLDCEGIHAVAESCAVNVDPPRATEAVARIYSYLAEDSEIRKALGENAGRAAPLLGARLERARLLCNRRQLAGRAGSTFEYSYPHGGFTARNIGHNGKNEMVKEQFLRVAELAVAGGVDPFLAMSVLVTEQTPLARNQAQTENYFRGYGVFPVDARPAYSYLKCSVEKADFADFLRSPAGAALKPHQALLEKIRAEGDAEGGTLNDRFGALMHQAGALHAAGKTDQARKIEQELQELQGKYQKAYNAAVAKLPKGSGAYASQLMEQYVTCWRSCSGINAGQCRKEACTGREAPVFDFGGQLPGAETQTFCSSSAAVNHGSAPEFSRVSGPGGPGACCFQLKAPPGSVAFASGHHAIGAMGLRTFWDDKMLRALKIVGKKGGGDSLSGDDAHKLARIAQMWNGWGRLNVTEKIKTCMGSINLAEKPVTGAKVMDLLVSSTLPNPVLAEAVMAAALKHGKPVKSLLCLYGGAGRKRMPAKAFHEQLNSRYLSGTGCR